MFTLLRKVRFLNTAYLWYWRRIGFRIWEAWWFKVEQPIMGKLSLRLERYIEAQLKSLPHATEVDDGRRWDYSAGPYRSRGDYEIGWSRQSITLLSYWRKTPSGEWLQRHFNIEATDEPYMDRHIVIGWFYL